MPFSLPFSMFSSTSPALGLERVESQLRAAVVRSRKGVLQLERLISLPDSGQPISLKKLFPTTLVVTAIEAPATLVRPLTIPLVKERDLQATLPFQAEPLLPYPIEEAVIEKIVLQRAAGSTMLSLLSVSKEHVAEHIASWQKIAIEPEVVSAVPAALAAFSLYIAAAAPLHFVVHVGDEQTCCILARNGLLLAAQAFSSGSSHLIRAYDSDLAAAKNSAMPELSAIDCNAIDIEAFPQLSAAVEAWRRQALLLLLSLRKQARGEVVEAALLVGEGARFPHLSSTIFSLLHVAPLSLAVSSNSPFTVEEQCLFAIPIGLAASQVAAGGAHINFRQKELAYPHPWRRLTKPLIFYCAAALSFAVAIVVACSAYLSQRDALLRIQYLQLLAATRKDYSSVEKQIGNRHFSSLDSNSAPIAVDELKVDDLATRIAFITKEFQALPELFPLAPQVPRVSDLLAWLAIHPHVTFSSAVKGEKSDRKSLQIESLSYTMVKRPEQNHKQEHYQIRVELELTSPAPKQARAFHDALIAPNEFVDPKGEVKWSSSQGRYRTSFFLKDKTAYPK